jgi:hypothetical protein
MRIHASLLAIPLLFPAAAIAQQQELGIEVVVSEALRDKFETVTSSPGWYLMGRDPDSYRIGIETAPDLEGRRVVTIKAFRPPQLSGALERSIKSAPFAGKRLKMTARLKKSERGFARFWLNVLGPDGHIVKTVHDDIVETRWRGYEILTDIPADTSALEAGVSVWGHPEVAAYVDVVHLAVADAGARPSGEVGLFLGGYQSGRPPTENLQDEPRD